MKKSDVALLAKQKVHEGKTHQQIFEEIKATSDMAPDQIADVIKVVPSIAGRQRTATLNIILIVLLSLITLVKVLTCILLLIQVDSKWGLLLFIFPLLYMGMIWGVATYAVRAHGSTAFVGMLGLLDSFRHPPENTTDPLWIAGLVIIVSVVILSLYIHSKLAPGYETVKEKYTDTEGRAKLRNKIVFKD